jgi:hypothetical protein
MVMRATLVNEDCDRCGKTAPELHPFKLSEVIHYRGKVIEKPWLCVRCLRIQKTKLWKQPRASWQEG